MVDSEPIGATDAQLSSEMSVSVIGNDEGDVHCTVCKRRDWYQGLQFARYDWHLRGESRTVICLRRYEGKACGELAKEALFDTNIPSGTFEDQIVK